MPSAARQTEESCSRQYPTLPPPPVANTTKYQLRVYGVPSGQSFSTARVQADSWRAATGAGFQLNFVRCGREGRGDR